MPGSAFASSPALGQLTRVETWTLELSNSVLNNTKGRVLKNPDFKLTLTLSYADTDRLSRDFAAWLQAQGVKKGDRIAVMTPNILAFPVAMLQMRTNVPHIFAIGDIVG
ncbi:MAG TPA: AMP-binding protein, partial [Ottowia sp.]|nr:AMP-binding protein [Burkholderiaceae bacterium]HNJ45927.1 AMP-binding protein [Ottowia sp.]HNK52838.1 AMP-binding protein [Ottowia sp.]HNL41751.1 AMP-binding protein [Ottowia sp.]HNN34180.1 AMP-binding protein [Ottowia sp.]